MFKSLAVIGTLAVAAPSLALAADPQPTLPSQAQGNAGTTQNGPSGPAMMTVAPPGLTNGNNPNSMPAMPDVFHAGQQTGGSPNPNGAYKGAASP